MPPACFVFVCFRLFPFFFMSLSNDIEPWLSLVDDTLAAVQSRARSHTDGADLRFVRDPAVWYRRLVGLRQGHARSVYDQWHSDSLGTDERSVRVVYEYYVACTSFWLCQLLLLHELSAPWLYTVSVWLSGLRKVVEKPHLRATVPWLSLAYLTKEGGTACIAGTTMTVQHTLKMLQSQLDRLVQVGVLQQNPLASGPSGRGCTYAWMPVNARVASSLCGLAQQLWSSVDTSPAHEHVPAVAFPAWSALMQPVRKRYLDLRGEWELRCRYVKPLLRHNFWGAAGLLGLTQADRDRQAVWIKRVQSSIADDATCPVPQCTGQPIGFSTPRPLPDALGSVLRPYQASAVSDLLRGARDQSAGVLVAPCGSGKTLMAAAWLSCLWHGQALVVTINQPSACQWVRALRQWLVLPPPHLPPELLVHHVTSQSTPVQVLSSRVLVTTVQFMTYLQDHAPSASPTDRTRGTKSSVTAGSPVSKRRKLTTARVKSALVADAKAQRSLMVGWFRQYLRHSPWVKLVVADELHRQLGDVFGKLVRECLRTDTDKRLLGLTASLVTELHGQTLQALPVWHTVMYGPLERLGYVARMQVCLVDGVYTEKLRVAAAVDFLVRLGRRRSLVFASTEKSWLAWHSALQQRLPSHYRVSLLNAKLSASEQSTLVDALSTPAADDESPWVVVCSDILREAVDVNVDAVLSVHGMDSSRATHIQRAGRAQRPQSGQCWYVWFIPWQGGQKDHRVTGVRRSLRQLGYSVQQLTYRKSSWRNMIATVTPIRS